MNAGISSLILPMTIPIVVSRVAKSERVGSGVPYVVPETYLLRVWCGGTRGAAPAAAAGTSGAAPAAGRGTSGAAPAAGATTLRPGDFAPVPRP